MWLYDENLDELDLTKYVGFVYLITNTVDDKRYIGQKKLQFKRTKTVKGKKKRILVDSDWKNYWGSNKNLLLDVEELGQDKFIRQILRLCKTKGEMNYYEAKYQFDCRVLESDRWYNDWILVRCSSSHLKKVDFSDNEDIMRICSK